VQLFRATVNFPSANNRQTITPSSDASDSIIINSALLISSTLYQRRHCKSNIQHPPEHLGNALLATEVVEYVQEQYKRKLLKVFQERNRRYCTKVGSITYISSLALLHVAAMISPYFLSVEGRLVQLLIGCFGGAGSPRFAPAGLAVMPGSVPGWCYSGLSRTGVNRFIRSRACNHGPCQTVTPKSELEGVTLIVRAISLQDFQPMWSWSTNVTGGQTDRRTDDMQ